MPYGIPPVRPCGHPCALHPAFKTALKTKCASKEMQAYDMGNSKRLLDV